MANEMAVTVSCDRCGKKVFGIRATDDSWTVGYYNVEDSHWHKYADEDETFICDDCMQSDERYKKDYPPALSGDDDQ